MYGFYNYHVFLGVSAEVSRGYTYHVCMDRARKKKEISAGPGTIPGLAISDVSPRSDWQFSGGRSPKKMLATSGRHEYCTDMNT